MQGHIKGPKPTKTTYNPLTPSQDIRVRRPVKVGNFLTTRVGELIGLLKAKRIETKNIIKSTFRVSTMQS